MATKGIKLRDKDNNIVLPVTSSDLVEVKYGGSSQILTNLLEQNEQIVAEALVDLNNRLENTASGDHTHKYYGKCTTGGTTAAKTVSIDDFTLSTDTVFTIEFTNTNYALTAPTLSINGGTAYQMYRRLDNNYVQVVGAFIRANYRYTFVFKNNRFELIDSDFHTDNVLEICCTDYNVIGNQMPMELMGDRYIAMMFVDDDRIFNRQLTEYTFILTEVANLNYLNTVYGSGYDYSGTSTLEAKAFSNWKSYVSISTSLEADACYINYLKSDGTQWYGCYKYVNSYKNFNFICTLNGAGHIRETNVKPGFINDNNGYKIGQIYEDEATVNCAEEPKYVVSSTQIFKPYVKLRSKPGVITTSMPNKLGSDYTKSANMTNANIVTCNFDSTCFNPTTSTTNAYTMLRYETPLITRVADYERPSTTNRLIRKYCLSYEGMILTAYNSGATATSYSECIVGNNYCDLSNSGQYDSGEMYYYNGTTLRNYLCAYVKGRDIDKKYIKGSTVLEWDTADTNNNKFRIFSNGIQWHDQAENPVSNFYSHRIDVPQIFVDGNSILLNGVQGVVCTRLPGTFSVTYAQRYYETSDERIKHDITRMTSNDDINVYSFIKNEHTSCSYGFIAQNVASTHPELISYSYNSTYMSVDYNSTLSLLLARAMNRIDELEKRVKILEEMNDAR